MTTGFQVKQMKTPALRERPITVDYDREFRETFADMIRAARQAREATGDLLESLREIRRMAWAASGFSIVGSLALPDPERNDLRNLLALIVGDIDLTRRRLDRVGAIDPGVIDVALARIEELCHACLRLAGVEHSAIAPTTLTRVPF
jgi:hypothetical protein